MQKFQENEVFYFAGSVAPVLSFPCFLCDLLEYQ